MNLHLLWDFEKGFDFGGSSSALLRIDCREILHLRKVFHLAWLGTAGHYL